MLIGYARTSTTDQNAGLEAQARDLLAEGCERLWREQTSALGPRNALEEAIAFARSGDSLVVTKICTRIPLSQLCTCTTGYPST
jgi:DNA invertase Pin-like site-specific DNA recombinase